MNTYLYIFLFVILLTIIEAFSQYNLKVFSQNNHIHYFIIGAIGYVLISAIISYLFGYEKMGIINNTFNVISSIVIVFIGYLFFQEKLSTVQIIGIIFGIFGMVLIGVDGYLEY